jgi:hypothetical protein
VTAAGVALTRQAGGAKQRHDEVVGWEEQMKGIRHFLRDFTATAVSEHLRSQIEATADSPDLTKNEIKLVRFICKGSFDWDAFLAERSEADSAGRRHRAMEPSKRT